MAVSMTKGQTSTSDHRSFAHSVSHFDVVGSVRLYSYFEFHVAAWNQHKAH